MELYKKVRLACAEGMSARAAAKHFNISRGTVEKMLAFSVPPGYRRVNERLKLTRFQRLKLTHPMWRKAPRRAALT